MTLLESVFKADVIAGADIEGGISQPCLGLRLQPQVPDHVE